ncbi:hypothetical protein C1645_832010 [Glomus cerebriforme]|uniref:Uncharacterized protein n=1 Tax=Glomus cerebriforme TaxID=658196 RepID=A0A397SKW6_9GLOM|nr:hypothetical protein C1645_832010 [Glomus cerebriforme]
MLSGSYPKVPIDVEILRQESASTNLSNNMKERIMITRAEEEYASKQNNQQLNQKNDNMEIKKEISVNKPLPDKSSTKKKIKEKTFTPHIITGYMVSPKLEQNMHIIMLYDVPDNWNAEEITGAINKDLGSLLKATISKKEKYQYIRATIVL